MRSNLQIVFLAVIIFSVMHTTINASEWRYLYTGVFYDYTSLSADHDGGVYVWIRDRTAEIKKKYGQKAHHSIEKNYISCSKRYYRILKFVIYSYAGEPLYVSNTPDKRMLEIVPDSLGEVMLTRICTALKIKMMPQDSNAPKVEAPAPAPAPGLSPYDDE